MRFSTSFSPNFSFAKGSGDFLFLSAKVQNIYHIDNQIVMFCNLIHDCPYNKVYLRFVESHDQSVA